MHCVSKHWKPDGNFPPGAGPWPVTLVLGAVFAGLLFAVAWQRWDDRAPPVDRPEIEWNEVQPVPRRVPDAEDREWEKRSDPSVIASDSDAIQPGLPRASGARNDGLRASFGYCHVGGGTNCVVDGDTFWIGGKKVRIAAIDAPETHPPRCAEEARLGNEATAMLRGLLNGGAVTMTRIDRDRDSYGRLLRNVAVDGQDVGEALISAGVARA